MKKISNYEYLRSLSIDGLAEWFESNIWNWENTPWNDWFDDTYCNNCDPEFIEWEGRTNKVPIGWCELHGKCKFLQHLDDIPDDKQVVKLWLEEKHD